MATIHHLWTIFQFKPSQTTIFEGTSIANVYTGGYTTFSQLSHRNGGVSPQVIYEYVWSAVMAAFLEASSGFNADALTFMEERRALNSSVGWLNRSKVVPSSVG